MSSDDLTDEEERRMAAKLLMGGKKRAGTVVEIRASGRKVPREPVALRFVHYVESYDSEWVYCDVEQKGDKGWFKLETYEDRKKAERAADKYERSGDTVERCVKKI